MEILTDRYYNLGAEFGYIYDDEDIVSSSNDGEDIPMPPVETVWGGEGEQCVTSVECETGFYFEKINRENIRSSWSSGQIPLLFYI